MHLFGTTDPAELETYIKAYNCYFTTIIKGVKTKTHDLLESIRADITQPVLANMVTKLQWLCIGFIPSSDPYINTVTLFSPFSQLSMHHILGGWNTAKIQGYVKEQQETTGLISNGLAILQVRKIQQKVKY